MLNIFLEVEANLFGVIPGASFEGVIRAAS